MSSDYPILLEIHQNGSQYITKAILLSYRSYSGTWANPDGSWESDDRCKMDLVKQYLEKNGKDLLPILTFQLQESDGVLRLTGFETAS